MAETTEDILVPGQGVLPGLEEMMRCEAASLSNYREELFCWEYFHYHFDPAKAYRAIWRPTEKKKELSDETAIKVGRRWLEKSTIKSRITEISKVYGIRLGRKVISDQELILELDMREFFKEDGSIVRPHEMDEKAGRLISLEARYVDGAVRYLPVFPDKQKVREQVAKITGIQAPDKMEVTGKNGGPVEHEHSLKGLMSEIMDTSRDLVREKVNDGRGVPGD